MTHPSGRGGDTQIDDASAEATADSAPPAPQGASPFSQTVISGGDSGTGADGHAASVEVGTRGMLSSAGFEVIGELGRGGMGIVYRAKEKSLDREVAVKVLRGGQGAPLFAAEARITGRLEHPNIPPVHAFQTGVSGQPYLAMKLVRGLPWSSLLDPKNEEEEARAKERDLFGHLEVLRRVCEAVAFAHARGVVHCDLKPQNVMVGAFGEVLVLDWGIAVDLSGRPPAAAPPELQGGGALALGPAFLEPSGVRGTPAYMSPEQARGRLDKIGPWTDVYLLGAILYKLLTGAPPHKGTSSEVSLHLAAVGEVIPPAARAPGRPVDEGLAAIAMRALDPQPARRHASAQDLARAIESHQRHAAAMLLAQSGARSVQQAEEAARGASSPALVYQHFGAAISALSEAVRGAADPASLSRAVHDARSRLARYAVRKGDLALAEAEIARIPEGDPLRVPAAAALEEARAAIRASHRLRLGLLCALGLVLLVTGALGWRARGKALRLEAARERRQRAQETITAASWGDFASKIAAAKRAAAIDPEWPGPWIELGRTYENDDTLATLSRGIDLSHTLGAYRNAAEAFERAISLGARDAQTIVEAGYAHACSGDWPRARRLYEQAAAMAASPSAAFNALDAAGTIALADGRFAEAESCFARGLALETGPYLRYEHAIALLALGRLDEAQAEADAALASDPASESYAYTRTFACLARGEVRHAGEALLAGLPHNDDSPHLLGLLGAHAARLGDGPRARAAFARARTARARLEQVCGDEPWYACLARVEGPVGLIGKAAMQEIEADALLAADPAPSVRARRQAEDALFRNDPQTALGQATLALVSDPADGAAYLARARALLSLGQREAALEDLKRADVLAVDREDEVREVRAALGR